MQTSKIAIGTAQFGSKYGISNKIGQIDTEEINAILNFAKTNYLVTIDTAVAYGDCEKRLGIIGVSEFQIISKIPPLNQKGRLVKDEIDEFFSKSLNDLRVT